jgi:eukaryotic-like serine/threonine-protein kinase
MAWSLPDYDEIQEIGTSSTGSVILSRDRATGTLVAVKYLSKQVYRSAGFADRFRDDARVLAGIESRHVATLFEYVEGPDSAALVMELVDGVSLRQIIDHDGALDPLTALYTIRAALLGLDDIHRRGITHGDVRPENLLIDARGIVKVVDTGIPALVRGHADPHYQAPEVATGQGPTPASDVYAAAVTLLECLTGRPPRAVNGKAAGRRIDEAESESLRASGVPEQVQTLLAEELSVRPSDRSISASALIDAVDTAARGTYGLNWLKAGEAALGRRLSPILLTGRAATDAVPTGRRKRRRALLVLGAVLIVVVGLGIFAIAGGLFGPHAGAPAIARPGPSLGSSPIGAPGPVVPSPVAAGPGGDTVRPDQPTGLTVIGRALTAITIDWNPTRDNVKVVGYILTRDGTRIGTTSVPSFTSSGLTADTTYAFAVTAFDAAGNLSLTSPAISATTLAQPDRTPPSAPADLRSTGQGTSTITLAWTPSHDDVGVAGYNVYRGGTLVGSATAPVFTDTGLAGATAYSYTVRAYDTSNNTSVDSPALTVTTLASTGTAAPAPSSASTSRVRLTIKRTPRPAPVCRTTIEVDVTITGGLLDIGNVHLTYTINGVTKSTTVLIDIDNVPTPVVLDSAVSGSTSGSATVTVTSPGTGPIVSMSWDPTVGCAPADSAGPP